MASIVPLGRISQPSSLLASALPVGFSAVNARVDGLKASRFVVVIDETTMVPLGSTFDIVSPTLPLPNASASCCDQVLVTGSYMKPMFVSTAPKPARSSPPTTTTRPSASTCDAKNRGA